MHTILLILTFKSKIIKEDTSTIIALLHNEHFSKLLRGKYFIKSFRISININK